MAALFCNTRRMELSEALGGIGELKHVISVELKKLGYTDVIDNESEVAGNRNGMRLSVLHLFIADRSFYQQVMAAGDNADATLAAVNEVVAAIKALRFL